MIVSLKYEFAFLCTPKNASTSIEALLKPYADIVIGGSPGLKHLSPSVYRKYLLPIVTRKHPNHRIESFCIVRDPLDWAESWYRYRTRRALKNPAHPHHRNYSGDLSFEAFIGAMLEESPPPCAKIGRQSAFMCDGKGRLLVDRVFRYEDLPNTCLWLSEKLGRPVNLPWKNASPRRDAALTPEMQSRFRESHALDYHLHERLTGA